MDDETLGMIQRHKEAAMQEGYITGIIHTAIAAVVALFLYKVFW